MHNAHACYPQEKWPTVCMAIQGGECSISATEQFQRKYHKFFDLVAALSRRTDTPEVRCDLTDTQTDMATTVTLAHAHQGLTM